MTALCSAYVLFSAPDSTDQNHSESVSVETPLGFE